MTMKPDVKLYADGSTVPQNPGRGGWGAVLIYGERIKGMYGTHPHGTNNYMEALAVLNGLRGLRKPCRVHVFSDSQYVIEGLSALRRNRYFKSNPELWRALHVQVEKHSIRATHVDGHSTVLYNELCHELANLGSKQTLEGSFYVHELEETSAEAKLLKKVERRIQGRKNRQAKELARVAR